MGSYSAARARGYPTLGEVNVIIDGQQWQKRGRDEERRYMRTGPWLFRAEVCGPRTWRFTAERDGVVVARALVGSLNAAKMRAALMVRGEIGT
jgi:hypothetical protein